MKPRTRFADLKLVVVIPLLLGVACGGSGGGIEEDEEQVEAALSVATALPFERVTISIGREVKAKDIYRVFVDGDRVLGVGPTDSIGFLAPDAEGDHIVAVEVNGARSKDLALTVVAYQVTPVPEATVLGGLAVLSANTNQIIAVAEADGELDPDESVAVADMQAGLDMLAASVDGAIRDLEPEDYELFIQIMDTQGVLEVLQELNLAGDPDDPATAQAFASAHAGIFPDGPHLDALRADVLSFVLGNLAEGLKIGVVTSVVAGLVTGGSSVAVAAVLLKLRTLVNAASLIIDGFMRTDLVYVARADSTAVQLGTGQQVPMEFVGTFETQMNTKDTLAAIALVSLSISGFDDYIAADGDTVEATLESIDIVVDLVADELVTLGFDVLASALGEALEGRLVPERDISLDVSLYQLDLAALLTLVSPGLADAMRTLFRLDPLS